jgi:hypothetical protein
MNKEQASEFIERIRKYGEELKPKQTIKIGKRIVHLKRGEPIRPEYWR